MENDELAIKEVELTRVNLQPGDVLMVKIYADDITPEHLKGLKAQLKVLFPDNKIILLALPIGSKIEMDVLDMRPVNPLAIPAGVTPVDLSCAEPTAYCNSCGCGKKERIEGILKK
jgi:hypothetical protein